MQRVFFTNKSDYKQSTPHVSDPNFIPLVIKYLDYLTPLGMTKKLKRMEQRKPSSG